MATVWECNESQLWPAIGSVVRMLEEFAFMNDTQNSVRITIIITLLLHLFDDLES